MFNKIILYAMFLLVLSSFGLAETWCYQESANTSNQSGIDGFCNLQYTGGYNLSNFLNAVNLTDGVWDNVGAVDEGDIGYFYVNYTKPSLNITNFRWLIKTFALTPQTQNITLNGSCIGSTNVQLKITVESNPVATGYNTFNFSCYDGSSWDLVSTQQTSLPSNLGSVWSEEAIWWNYSAIVPSTDTCFQESANVSDQTGIDGTCSLDYTGNYSYTSLLIPNNAYDGDWTTYSTKSGGAYGFFYVDYIKPYGATLTGTNFSVGYNLGSILNMPINSSCWNAIPGRLRFDIAFQISPSTIAVYCWNGTPDWDQMIYKSSGAYYGIFEEAMQWNISSVPNTSILVNLTSPTNSFSTQNNYINFSYNVTGQGVDLRNCSLYTNLSSWHLNKTNTTQVINNSVNYFNDSFFPIGSYKWNVKCCASDENCSFAISNYTFNIVSALSSGIDNCTSFSMRSLNFTIYNETSNTPFALDTATELGTFIYNNGTAQTYNLGQNNKNFGICIYPNESSFSGSYSLFYSASDYPQRTFYNDSLTYNNITQQVKLYLLSTDEGLYASFLVLDLIGIPVSNVIVTMEKLYSPTYQTISIEKTDDAGGATFWVNPDTTYKFTFAKSGCVTKVQTLRPTSTDTYSVTLNCGEAQSTYNHSVAEGITYQFLPLTDLQNGTVYTMVFNISSNYWDLSNCSFYLYDNASNLLGQNITLSIATARHCWASISLNTSNLTNLKVLSLGNYFVNGTQQQVKNIYSIIYEYIGEFSLKTIIDDLSSFGESGFNNFTRWLIALIIIVISVSLVSYNLEVTDPDILVIITLFLIWFFSFINWFNLANFYTSLGNYNDVWIAQYAIALFSSLLGGSYILKRHMQ